MRAKLDMELSVLNYMQHSFDKISDLVKYKIMGMGRDVAKAFVVQYCFTTVNEIPATVFQI